MRNRYVCAAIILLMLLTLLSCRAVDNPADDGADSTPAPSAVPVQTENPVPAEEPPVEAHDPEFSLGAGEMTLTLREAFPDQRIEEISLSLLSDNTETLGEGSDTYAGSYIRTISYDGLELALFAPSDNENAFWIMAMTTDTPSIETYRGVQAGDTLAYMQEKYPEAESAPNDNGGDIYRFAAEYSELAFHVSEDIVTRITMTYYLP